ncbi:4119_t:CDS:2 [Entrophospora sp. SA101]|nr:4119_t:CDS:2 [Entrophospora sp. SA101]
MSDFEHYPGFNENKEFWSYREFLFLHHDDIILSVTPEAQWHGMGSAWAHRFLKNSETLLNSVKADDPNFNASANFETLKMKSTSDSGVFTVKVCAQVMVEACPISQRLVQVKSERNNKNLKDYWEDIIAKWKETNQSSNTSLLHKHVKRHIMPFNYREATLVLNMEKFQYFPVNAISDFYQIRVEPEYAYFDRTNYISVLESFGEKVLLFLRPHRFGKSLTLSMLAHFHGIEHKKRYYELFQDLDVDKDVQKGKVIPGQYLILSLDFAGINRSNDLKIAEAALHDMINDSIEQFYRTYASYLERPYDNLQKLIKQDNSISSISKCISIVQDKLRTVEEEGDSKHLLANVKGIYLLADEYDAFSNEYLDPEDHSAWIALSENKQSLLKGFWARVWDINALVNVLSQ